MQDALAVRQAARSRRDEPTDFLRRVRRAVEVGLQEAGEVVHRVEPADIGGFDWTCDAEAPPDAVANHGGDRTAGQTGNIDAALHAGGHRFHRKSQRQPVLSLSAAGLAAYADCSHRTVARQERPESLCRLCHANGRGDRPVARSARQAWVDRQHASRDHQRQRLLAASQVRRAAGQGAQSQPCLPRPQGRHFRRGTPHSVSGPLARAR